MLNWSGPILYHVFVDFFYCCCILYFIVAHFREVIYWQPRSYSSLIGYPGLQLCQELPIKFCVCHHRLGYFCFGISELIFLQVLGFIWLETSLFSCKSFSWIDFFTVSLIHRQNYLKILHFCYGSTLQIYCL